MVERQSQVTTCLYNVATLSSKIPDVSPCTNEAWIHRLPQRQKCQIKIGVLIIYLIVVLRFKSGCFLQVSVRVDGYWMFAKVLFLIRTYKPKKDRYQRRARWKSRARCSKIGKRKPSISSKQNLRASLFDRIPRVP